MDNDDLNERHIYHKYCNVLISQVVEQDKRSRTLTAQSPLHLFPTVQLSCDDASPLSV